VYIRADTLDDVMRRVFRKLLTDGRAINPSRDPAVEVAATLLHLTNPRARLSRSESRGRIFSALGELLWYLAKTDALDFIRYYIPEYEESSDDGKTIHGAYGPRLFNDNGIDQIANVIAVLRNRADSRRAVIQLFRATDISHPYKDVPCTCSMQFMLRGGQLDLVTTMRSNDAYLGLPHDIFCFTMLQELVARSVRAEVGQYYHMIGSLHLYDKHREGARLYLREGWQATTRAMPPMPTGTPWRSIERLRIAERAIREGRKITIGHLHNYWKDLVRLLKIFRLSQQGKPARIAQLKRQMNSPAYAPYIETRQQLAETRATESVGALNE